MGKTRTPAFRLEFKCISGKIYTPQEWRVRSHRLYGPGYGTPTVENIKAWARSFEESMISGTNRHLGIDQVIFARVVDQRTGEVVATWDRRTSPLGGPLFRVIA